MNAARLTIGICNALSLCLYSGMTFVIGVKTVSGQIRSEMQIIIVELNRTKMISIKFHQMRLYFGLRWYG